MRVEKSKFLSSLRSEFEHKKSNPNKRRKSALQELSFFKRDQERAACHKLVSRLLGGSTKNLLVTELVPLPTYSLFWIRIESCCSANFHRRIIVEPVASFQGELSRVKVTVRFGGLPHEKPPACARYWLSGVLFLTPLL